MDQGEKEAGDQEREGRMKGIQGGNEGMDGVRGGKEGGKKGKELRWGARK